MTGLRLMLVTLWSVLLIYTVIVIARNGWGLVPIYFGDIGAVTWPGQFNLDFLCFLILSALWTAWRNRFSSLGLLLTPVALFGGAGFLLPYLTVLTFQTRGDIQEVLTGDRRTS